MPSSQRPGAQLRAQRGIYGVSWLMVGATGLEPATPCSQTSLRVTPNLG
jgi:hypothetical protein